MHVVATTNSLFETTDESCPQISGIPTVLLINPCENSASFFHKNGRNWHFSSLSFMVSDNSTYIFYYPRYPPGQSQVPPLVYIYICDRICKNVPCDQKEHSSIKQNLTFCCICYLGSFSYLVSKFQAWNPSHSKVTAVRNGPPQRMASS